MEPYDTRVFVMEPCDTRVGLESGVWCIADVMPGIGIVLLMFFIIFFIVAGYYITLSGIARMHP